MGYKCSLSPELQERAIKELNEDPSRRAEDIEHIRQWLLKQPHITAKTDDWTILRFLRGCKFSLEKTKQKLDTYYTCKAMVPEWYANRDPQDKKIREILEMGLFLPLNGTDREGRRVMISRLCKNDPKVYPLELVFKAGNMIFETMLEEDEVYTITGIINLEDTAGITANHILAFTPTLAKKVMVISQDGYPVRPKGIHYINTPPTFDTIFNIFKGFMKEKIRKRVHIHGSDMESLHKHIPKEMLPVEYGGTNGTVQEIIDHWIQRLDARRDWLLEDEKYKVDESKRPGKPKTTSDLFGLDGSFRKLNVD